MFGPEHGRESAASEGAVVEEVGALLQMEDVIYCH